MAKRTSNKDKLNATMLMLIEAHQLLSKTPLDMATYQPISILLNKSKLLITEVIQNKVMVVD